jgi:hypothetical protein
MKSVVTIMICLHETGLARGDGFCSGVVLSNLYLLLNSLAKCKTSTVVVLLAFYCFDTSKVSNLAWQYYCID